MTATQDTRHEPDTTALQVATGRPALPPMALARIAGLPVEVLDDLRDDAAAAWARSVLTLELAVSALAEGLSDALHDLVGDNDDQDERRFLVNLRRRAFRGQPLADPDADVARVSALDVGTGRLVLQWHLAERALAARVAAGSAIVDADLAESRAALQRLVERPELRAGILVASPPLSAQLGGYLRTPAGKVDKKRRKLERSLMSYVGRTVVKPSPFGTFTPVQVATFGPGGDTAAGFAVSGTTRSRVRLNVAVLNRVCRLVLDDPAKRADLPVVATSGWARDDDRIRYVRRWIEAGEEAQAVTFDAVTDKLFFLRNGEALDELLDLIDQPARHGPAPTFATVARWLATRHDADAEQGEAYLAALLHVGLVEVPGLQVPVHAADPVGALAEVLRGLATLGPGGVEDPAAWAVDLAAALDGVRRRLATYAEADLAERTAVLADVRAALVEVVTGLGDPSGAVPQTLVYEDTVAGDAPIALDADAWQREVVGPVEAVAPILRAWDVTLAQRLTLEAYFVARHGVGGRADDVLGLVHDFTEDFFDQYQTMSGQRSAYVDGVYQPEINWLRSAEVDRLDAARVVLTDAVTRAYAGHERDEEITLDRAAVAAVAEHTDRLPLGDEPRSHLVQVSARSDAAPRIVLNQGYGGLHFPFSRFAHAFPAGVDGTHADLAETLRERARTAAGPGVVHAEVTGGPVTSNLNLHGRLTDHEIVCPGEQSSVPPEQQIHLDDLYAVHLPIERRVALRSRRLDVEVVPTYLGYLIPLALPEIPRTLLLFAQTSMGQFDPWAGQAEAPVTDGVGYRPRVTCGGVVLRRRSWAVGVDDLPVGSHAPAPADEAARLLAWQRWRTAHRLPDRVFVKVQVASGFRGAGSSKPMYVDFASVLSLHALEAALEPDALVLLTEALPDPGDPATAPGVSSAGRHVVELAVEHRPAPTSPAPERNPS
jgi:hypothetical protein